MITKELVQRGENFIIKFDKPLETSENGILHESADEFLTRIDKETQFLNKVRYIPMEGLSKDIEYLRVKSTLRNMKKSNGSQIDKLADVKESIPQFIKKTLEAAPLVAWTQIPKTFLETNIEGEGFMNHYQSELAEDIAFAQEQVAFYADSSLTAPVGDTDNGLFALDGIFKQLKDIRAVYTSGSKEPKGFHTDISLDTPIIPQLSNMFRAFTRQKGKIANASLFVDSDLYSRIVDEVAERETDKGDGFYFDGAELRVRGVKVETLDVLDNNPYEEFTSGFASQKTRYCLLCDVNQIAMGAVKNLESENSYEHLLKSYVASTECFFDIAIIYAEDVLAAEVIEASPDIIESVAFKVLEAADDDPIDGATVEIELPGANKTGTTGAAGGCNITNVPEGTHDVNVSKANFTSKTVSVDFNDAMDTVIIKLAAA